MKRVYILMLACLGAVSVMAQNQRLKQRIIAGTIILRTVRR